MYKNLDLSALSVDDIVEEYKTLHERHQQLKSQCEEDAQRIHELKRSLDTSLAAEKYLTQELEHLNNQAQAACPSTETRLQQELEELRRKYRTLQSEHETLQQDNEAKQEETRCLKLKLEATEREVESSVTLKAGSAHDECMARLNEMEQENAELMQKLADYEDAKVQNTFAVAEQEKTIELLKDQVSCLEENLRGKRDELEEKLQLLESSQEQLVDANAKIALLSSAPENNDRKGNSLFAEVDDQRQVMKHLLASQKKSYLDMKKIFTESKFEIRRLKRENIAMHTELQACSTIFCSADKTYQNKLNERIRQLMVQNVKLEQNLTVSQERLRELASQKSVTWLDSMLDFCKRETDELKTQLHSMHIQKATIEEQMRNVQQEMARWRFESLKSRCVLIDRENLLTEHKIVFKPVNAMEFDIKEAQIKAALPRIVTVSTPLATTASIASSKNLDTPTGTINLVTPFKTEKTEVIVLDTPLKVEADCTAVETKQQEQQNVVECKTELGLELIKDEQELLSSTKDNEQKPAAIELLLNRKGTEAILLDTSLKVETNSTSIVQIKQEQQTEPKQVDANEMDSSINPQLGLIKVKADQELLSPRKVPATNEYPVAAKPNRKGTPVKFAKIKSELCDEDIMPIRTQLTDAPVETKEELDIVFQPLYKATPIKTELHTMETVAMQETTNNNNLRSIMVKRRNLFADDKSVHFSSQDPIVHNISPMENSKENDMPAVGKDTKPAVNKSQCVIRRIIVAPKKTGLPLK